MKQKYDMKEKINIALDAYATWKKVTPLEYLAIREEARDKHKALHNNLHRLIKK